MFRVCSLVYGDEANLLCYEEYSEERVNELKALMIAEVIIQSVWLFMRESI